MSKLKMFFLLLLLPLNLCSAVEYFDASGIDYCQMFCFNILERNTGCDCNKKAGRQDLIQETNLEEFRQIVVDAHNELRNKLARGDEPGYPEAADMHMIRYDLELEHLARCYGLSRIKDLSHEPCRTTTYCYRTIIPQTIYADEYNPFKERNYLKFTRNTLRNFYNNPKNRIPESVREQVLKKFDPGSEEIQSHVFIRFIWAKVVRVGCALVGVKRLETMFLICNYASRGSSCGVEPLRPVYTFGTKCSLCDSKKCDKDLGGKYDALCTEDIEEYDEDYDAEAAKIFHGKSAATAKLSKEKAKNASVTLNVSVFPLLLFVILVNLFK